MSPVRRYTLHVIEEPGGTFQLGTWKPDTIGLTSEETGLTAEQVVERILAPPRHKRILMLDSKRNSAPTPESLLLLLRDRDGLGLLHEAPCPDCGDKGVLGGVPCPTCQC